MAPKARLTHKIQLFVQLNVFVEELENKRFDVVGYFESRVSDPDSTESVDPDPGRPTRPKS